MEREAKNLLFARLDECLKDRAKELMEPRDQEGRPFIRNIYYLQESADVHCYLKTAHEFNAKEVSDLLHFADPLQVAVCCWEANEDKYALPISELIEKNHFREHFAPATERSVGELRKEKPSLRDQLHAAKKEAARPTHQKQEKQRGGDAR